MCVIETCWCIEIQKLRRIKKLIDYSSSCLICVFLDKLCETVLRKLLFWYRSTQFFFTTNCYTQKFLFFDAYICAFEQWLRQYGNVCVLTKLKVNIVPDFQTSVYPVHIRRPWDTVDEGGEQVDGFKRLNGIDRFYDVVFFSKIMSLFTMRQSA